MDSFFVDKAFQAYDNLMSSSGVRCYEVFLGTVVLNSVSGFSFPWRQFEFGALNCKMHVCLS